VKERGKLVPFTVRRPASARVAEFGEIARQLQEERAVSKDIVSSTLRNTRREAWASLRERRELRTAGALERLGQEVDQRLDTNPRDALTIAELATAIAGSLAPGSYPAIMLAQLRTHAWRDRGQALSYLGRYEDALGALDQAEEQLREFGTLGHDQATVRFCRATLLQHLRRFDEARTILDECRQVFQSYGDTQSYVKCTLAMGNLLVRVGDYRAAREMLSGLLGSDDTLREATVRCTLGWCAIHLSRLDEALSHFDEVSRCIAESPVHVARASYGIGSAHLRLGDLQAAIQHLQSARWTFLVHNLVEEAGLSGLEIVEALLLQNEPAAARRLSAQIVGEFTAARLNRRAITALAYLHDAVATTNATAKTARNVYDYIAALRADPTREFVTIN
jgi:tetratricopeptide (TPR) repeat protein